MIKKICILVSILFLTACSNPKEAIVNKLKKLDYQCKDNICSLDQWMTGVYDSFDFNNDTVWSTTIAQCDTLAYSGATFEINFNKDLLTIIEDDKVITCKFNSEDKIITECSNQYEDAQVILDTLLTNLGQLNLSYDDLK